MIQSHITHPKSILMKFAIIISVCFHIVKVNVLKAPIKHVTESSSNHPNKKYYVCVFVS